MNAIRIRKRIDSDTLHLPELREMMGKMVEIIVLEEVPFGDRIGCFDGLPEGSLDPKELEALRTMMTEKQFQALYEISTGDRLDVDAIARLRAVSTT